MADTMIPVIGIERLRMGIDGDGVRTLIGTYGCPLRCKYCLNPQSWRPSIIPKCYSSKELYQKIAVDSIYFQATNGGITFGGGEPLMHIEGIAEFADLSPKLWSIWAETSLYVEPSTIVKASNVIDHFIVDIKTTDKEEYQLYTGKCFDLAFSNLQLLKTLVGSNRITVRIPEIPGFVSKDSQERSLDKISNMGFSDIDLFSYRTDINK